MKPNVASARSYGKGDLVTLDRCVRDPSSSSLPAYASGVIRNNSDVYGSLPESVDKGAASALDALLADSRRVNPGQQRAGSEPHRA